MKRCSAMFALLLGVICSSPSYSQGIASDERTYKISELAEKPWYQVQKSPGSPQDYDATFTFERAGSNTFEVIVASYGYGKWFVDVNLVNCGRGNHLSMYVAYEFDYIEDIVYMEKSPSYRDLVSNEGLIFEDICLKINGKIEKKKHFPWVFDQDLMAP